MKPTRAECIEQAIKSSVLCNEYMWLHVTPESLESFAIAMYRRGAEDMRERAARIAAPYNCYEIRALPIGDSND